MYRVTAQTLQRVLAEAPTEVGAQQELTVVTDTRLQGKQAVGDGPVVGQDEPAAVLRQAPSSVRIKLPRSFDPQSLPGAWDWSASVDARGVIKFIVASR